MTDRITKLNQIQSDAKKAWVESGFNSTLKIATGVGKTKIAFDCCYYVLENNLFVNARPTIRVWAETTARERTIREDEAGAYFRITGKAYLNDFNILFRCYQAGFIDDPRVELEIYDEVDTALSAVYSKCISESKCSKKLGLTATNTENLTVFKDAVESKMIDKVSQSDKLTKRKIISDLINKGQMMQVLLPISFEYPIEDAIADGILANYKTMIISHNLDITKSSYKLFKNQKKLFTEYQYYEWCLKIAFDQNKESYVKQNFYRKSVKILYNLNSKVELVKRLLVRLNGKRIIIFGVEKEMLYKITPNVIEPDNIDQLLDDYNSGKINILATSKMLSRGKTLERLPEYAIFVSYYSKSTDFLQKLGRLVRYAEDHIARIVFIVTSGTHETNWIDSLTKVKNEKNEVEKVIDLKIEKRLHHTQI